MKQLLKDFREFALKGNVIDLAVAVVIGVAFNAVVTSLVNDVIMPPIGLLLGRVDFSELYLNLSGAEYATRAEAQEAGAATVNYGVFIQNIVDFLIIAFVIFLFVQQVNRFMPKPPPPPPATTKDCPYCCSVIALAATRCPSCTSDLATT